LSLTARTDDEEGSSRAEQNTEKEKQARGKTVLPSREREEEEGGFT
jgi:hypothetical protein